MKLLFENPETPGRLPEGFRRCMERSGPSLFAAGEPITVARAPARIDCMGGIADYSGSVVFEGPLGRAAIVAFQPQEGTRLRVRSDTMETAGRPADVAVDLAALRDGSGAVRPYDDVRHRLTGDPERAWAAYVLGVPAVLEREGVLALESGGTFLLWSDIPIGVGVASSAAVEVAAMFAMTSHFGVRLTGTRLAELAQMVENNVVGAPCGIMDQVTAVLGQAGKLLAIRCQPGDGEAAQVLGQHELPDGVKVYGLSSRVEHSVGGSAYARARVSAFMGLKIILSAKGSGGSETADADHYLCNLEPDEYVSRFRGLLPERITGEEFLQRWGETTDPVTSVEPDLTYRVRAGTDHPVFENRRVQAFIDYMDRAREGDRTALVEAGGLMYASHHSYGWNCGLGCEETDLLVRMVRRRGPEEGFYGAKITGGGSGGTVAVLAHADAEGGVREIAREYESATGLEPDLFDETSPGTLAFGARRCRLQEDAT